MSNSVSTSMSNIVSSSEPSSVRFSVNRQGQLCKTNGDEVYVAYLTNVDDPRDATNAKTIRNILDGKSGPLEIKNVEWTRYGNYIHKVNGDEIFWGCHSVRHEELTEITYGQDYNIVDVVKTEPTDEIQSKKNLEDTFEKSKEFVSEKRQTFYEQLYEEMNSSGNSIIIPDYVINFVDEDGTNEPFSIKVHKIVFLPFEFFSSGFKMGRTEEITIVVKNLSKGIMDVIIKYIYTGKIEYSEIMNIFEEIIILADYLLLKNLMISCFKIYFFHTGEVPFIRGISIDYHEDISGSGFLFEFDYDNISRLTWDIEIAIFEEKKSLSVI